MNPDGPIGQRQSKAAIWDMDGVIVDTKDLHFRAWQRLMGERGETLSYEKWLPTFGRKNADILRELLPTDLPREDIEAMSDRKEVYFREEVGSGVRELPGVRRLLEELRDAGYAQAIGSSAPPENVRLILDMLDLRQFFAATVTGGDISQGKPSPEVFLVAAQRLGVPAKRSVVIEDAVAGVEAARAGGMAVIAVTNTRTREQLWEADVVVDSLEDVTSDMVNSLISAQ